MFGSVGSRAGRNRGDIRYQTLAAFEERVLTATLTGNTNLDLSKYNHFNLTLAASVTVTFINPPVSDQQGPVVFPITLKVTQNATGGFALAVAGQNAAGATGAIKWPNNVAPTVTTTASKTDFLTFLTYGGDGNYFGFVGGTNM